MAQIDIPGKAAGEARSLLELKPGNCAGSRPLPRRQQIALRFYNNAHFMQH